MSEHTSHTDYGLNKKKLGIYSTGIILCIILTIIPFYAVMHGLLSKAHTLHLILATATLQFLTQVFCFLSVNSKTEQGKTNYMSFVFTIVIIAVLIVGSIWIMANLDYNMM
jgi:cytochrome o ubiquinol oxidase operon protein cyoD